ncbi:MAG TPA: hypothetical protein PKB02_16405, partial [Anaerohalosphaeraceae bacterium]|nr:hypothetical protein [Anaerohalosphaeraceae bacterium]
MYNKQFNLTQILIGVILIGGLATVCIFAISGHPLSIHNPYALGIVCVGMMLAEFDSWKDNKREFFRRCLLATPFALLLIILSMLILPKSQDFKGFHSNVFYYVLGMLLFFGLIAKTNQLKRHYAVTLAAAVICFVAMQILRTTGRSGWGMYVALGCGLPVIVFYIGYYKKLHENRDVEIYPLAMESIRFMVAIFLLLLLFAG